MIAKIKRGNSFRGAVGYNMKEGKGEFIYSNIPFVKTKEDVPIGTNYLIMMSKKNKGINEPVFHASLSFAKEDKGKINNDDLINITREFLSGIGFNSSEEDLNKNYYLLFKHNDTEHEHIHIVASRIRQDGYRVDLNNDFYKSMEVLRKIEKKYGLREVPNEKSDIKTRTKNEIEFKEELKSIDSNFKSGREIVISSLNNVLNKKLHIKDFVSFLNENNVDVKFAYNKNDIYGISFLVNSDEKDFLIKGSSLGKKYSWNNLRNYIDYDFEKDKIFIQKTDKIITRNFKEYSVELKQKSSFILDQIQNKIENKSLLKDSIILNNIFSKKVNFSSNEIRSLAKIYKSFSKGNNDEIILNKVLDVYEKHLNSKSKQLNKSLAKSNINIKDDDLIKTFEIAKTNSFSSEIFYSTNSYINGYNDIFLNSKTLNLNEYLSFNLEYKQSKKDKYKNVYRELFKHELSIVLDKKGIDKTSYFSKIDNMLISENSVAKLHELINKPGENSPFEFFNSLEYFNKLKQKEYILFKLESIKNNGGPETLFNDLVLKKIDKKLNDDNLSINNLIKINMLEKDFKNNKLDNNIDAFEYLSKTEKNFSFDKENIINFEYIDELLSVDNLSNVLPPEIYDEISVRKVKKRRRRIR